MQKKNRILSILKDKTGASFIFVLGIMLLLMTIGISVLVAASANAGFVIKQKEHNQIMIMDDSVHKNIMYSLQHDASDDGLLSVQLVKAVYEANDPDLTLSYSPAGLADIPLEVNINNGVDLKSGNISVESITLSFPEQNVIITPPVPAVYENIYDDENLIGRTLASAREPQTATVDAKMVVTVEINAKGKITTTRAIYEYTGGKFSDDPDGTSHAGDESGARFDMVFTSDGYGKWRLIKHENIDSTD